MDRVFSAGVQLIYEDEHGKQTKNTVRYTEESGDHRTAGLVGMNLLA